jgi:acyl transferase domain-containing protein/acyl carrier protein
MDANHTEPIAIIGMGCRLPGAPDIRAFWRMLAEGRHAIREVPSERWNVDAFYDPRPATRGKMITRRGGFVEDIERFDAFFFGIPPRQATRTDPQQRMLLEAAWEAMENAGLRLEQLGGAQCGVFVGICSDDYLSLQRMDISSLDIYTGMGGNRGAAPGRLAYFFGLNGPCSAVDSACSSSLVAVHFAVNSLRAGNCAMAFAGGANAMLHPFTAIAFSQAGMLSPDGLCKAFDERANGFVRAEGAGVVLLKPLTRALTDGDPVWAVIRGSAVNNDGPTSPMMTPSRIGQELVLRSAYQDAGIPPSAIDYVEAHGTGTSVGDPIEMEALNAVIGQGRAADQVCLVGSSKTNVGHLEAGAGVVGLIKVALSLKYRQVPPSLHCETLNPKIPWDRLPFRVQRELVPWPHTNGRPALAAVNSFGISGTNAHAILEEAPLDVPRPSLPEGAPQLLALSAQSEQSLQDNARAYQRMLAGEPAALWDLCYSAGARRTHHDHRLAVVARTREELSEQLGAYLAGEPRRGLVAARGAEEQPRPIFVFSGVGTQWVGMGRALRQQEPVFRKAIERCDAIFRRLAGWSVLEQIEGPCLGQVEVMQPAIFSIQVALAALWRSWGVEPAAVIGHSLGEMAAAYVAGALTLEDAALVVRMRSHLMQRLNGKGRMAAVELGMEEARAIINGFQGLVDLAVSNSPTSSVLSGDPAALDRIVADLDSRSVFARFVRAEVAFHSRQVEPLMPELLEALAELKPAPARVPLYSTVTGVREDGTGLDAAYWVRNMRQPVLFAPALERLLEAGCDTFLEVSPNPVLAVPIRQTSMHSGRPAVILPSLARHEDERFVLLESLGALYASGYPVDWDGLFPGGGRFLPPPAYAWHRERYWFEEEGQRGAVRRVLQNGWGAVSGISDRRSSHPLLAQHCQSADDPGTHFWEAEIDTERYPYLKDHRMQGTALVPMALYVEMALAASIEAFGAGPRTVCDLVLLKPVFVPDTESRRLQLTMKTEGATGVSFRIHSLEAGVEHSSWTLHATGKMEFNEKPLEVGLEMDFSPAHPAAGWDKELSREEFYDNAQHRGVDYGPAFRGIERAWQRGDHSLTEIRVPEHAARGPHQIHPALLDIFFQTLLAGESRTQRAALPVGFDALQVLRSPDPGERLWGRAWLFSPDGTNLCGRLVIFDDNGHAVAREAGHRGKYLDQKTEPTRGWLYEQRWAPMQRSAGAPASQGYWLILADRLGVGERLCAMLQEHGQECLLIPPGRAPESSEGMLELLRGFRSSGPGHWRGVVHLCALDAPATSQLAPESLAASQRLVCASALAALQAVTAIEATPRFSFVTRGAQAVTEGESPAVAQAPLIGFARVAASEHPALLATNIDLEPGSADAAGLFKEIWHADREQEIALRGGIRYASRLCRVEQPEEACRRPAQAGESFRLDASGDGILDHLVLRATERRVPGPGEIEIDVAYAGLNFLDVLRALNMAPGLPSGPAWFGMECSGTVLAAGEGVRHLAPGDEVIAMHSGGVGCLTRYLTISARRAMCKPPHLSLEDAASIPVAYQTAYYALHNLGRMRAGESVLIHCAAGGVGLAAVRLAQAAGLEIFATAGTPEKRDYLKSLGIRYVMNSRTLDFAEEVMQYTSGRGVDLVLNSLAGEAIPRSLSLLATGGRFLEIGKRDIYADARLSLLPFQRNLSFHAVDLLRMSLERPDVMESLMAEIAGHIGGGTFHPLPYRAFPISQAADAFRHMAQGKHLGKVIIALRESGVTIEENPRVPGIRSDATYLITGGLGALGLAYARDLVDRGARHIALIGRRGPDEAAAQTISRMRETANVEVFSADVSQPGDVDTLLTRIARVMPPIKGVLHAAGILDDGTLQQLDWRRFERVLAPKVQGGWNLHARLAGSPLDFFVLFSSSAATFGAAGQGNYAAANAFLDALARCRAAAGLPALSIAWAGWGEIGMAANPEIAARIAAEGRQAIPVREGLALLDKLRERRLSQVTVAPIDWPCLSASHPQLRNVPFLSALVPEMQPLAASQQGNGDVALIAQVLTAPDAAAGRKILEDHLRKQISRVLRIEESRLDPQVGLTRLGLDSLMAVELKNRIESGLGCPLPVTKLLTGATLAQLAAYLYDGIARAKPTRSDEPLDLSGQQVDGLVRERAAPSIH